MFVDIVYRPNTVDVVVVVAVVGLAGAGGRGEQWAGRQPKPVANACLCLCQLTWMFDFVYRVLSCDRILMSAKRTPVDSGALLLGIQEDQFTPLNITREITQPE